MFYPPLVKCQEIFILGSFSRVIFKGFLFCIFFCTMKVTSLKNLTQILCHKIVHITCQCKRSNIVLMIVQISVQRVTRASSIV